MTLAEKLARGCACVNPIDNMTYTYLIRVATASRYLLLDLAELIYRIHLVTSQANTLQALHHCA